MIDKMAYKKGLIWYSKGKTEPAIRMIERASLLGNIDAKKWLENNPQTNR